MVAFFDKRGPKKKKDEPTKSDKREIECYAAVGEAVKDAYAAMLEGIKNTNLSEIQAVHVAAMGIKAAIDTSLALISVVTNTDADGDQIQKISKEVMSLMIGRLEEIHKEKQGE